MIKFPSIDPIIFSLGPLKIRWYSLSYILGILIGHIYAKYLVQKFSLKITIKNLDDFFSIIVLGIVIGGRLGYILFYDPIKYLMHPIDILKIYEGGMSFHGGVLGFAILGYIFCIRNKINPLIMADIVAVVAPIGIFLGRIANFINGELYGKMTNVPWAMIFPYSDLQPRHPSQLYEAICEGLILFIIMNYLIFYRQFLKKPGYCLGVFLICYGIFRIIIEIFRQADFQIFSTDILSMGQVLCLPMIMTGIYILKYRPK